MHGMAAALQPLRGRDRKQIAQAAARQQKMRAARAREQRVMQHAQEDAAAGLCGWQIEGRHAQRLDEFIEQALWQTAADIGNGCSICAAKALNASAGHGPAGRHVRAATSRWRWQCRPGRPAARAGREAQAAAIGIAHGQWPAQQGLLRRYAHDAHEPQAFGIGADQNVLAVVGDGAARQFQIAGPATQLAAGFENRGLMAAERELYCGSHAGPAATDDGNLHGALTCGPVPASSRPARTCAAA
jgi:hypothetical protein